MLRWAFPIVSLYALSACASTGPIVAQPGQPLQLAPGQSATLSDRSTLRYVEVTADSRCPPGVQCIRAGDASVAFELVPAGSGDAKAFELNTVESPTTTIAGWRVRLLDLEFSDKPKVTVQLDRER